MRRELKDPPCFLPLLTEPRSRDVPDEEGTERLYFFKHALGVTREAEMFPMRRELKVPYWC